MIFSVDETGVGGLPAFTFTEPGEKLALVCLGKPITLNVIELFDGPKSVNEIAVLPLLLRLIGRRVPAEILKSEAGTVRVNEVLWLILVVASVPVTVSVIVPASAPKATATVRVELKV